MQESLPRISSPAKAKAYFEDKLAFTTGPVELDHMIKSGNHDVIVVDVRAAEDFAKGHIPGAVNLPHGTWENGKGLAKDKNNVVYCYSLVCHLATKACLAFAEQGYPVMELEGGFDSWKAHDLDIEPESFNRVQGQANRGAAQRARM
ncbi:Sulfurtransferase [Verrucomicrobia bacterium]|nr:Sulfurtransferase [Verrucomicrobiota bacterium]